MKATIETCRDTFKIGYEAFESSRAEAAEVWDLYHNRHYTSDQLTVLDNRGQPRETFNVIKMFTRMLLGYFGTVVNEVTVYPKHPRDSTTATVLNDTISHILQQNKFDVEGDKIKLSGLLAGIMCSFVDVVDTGEKDEFGRAINEVVISAIPDHEIILDHMSTADDYSDARYLHRFKWMTESEVKKLFGAGVVDKMQANYNYTDAPEADIEFSFTNSFAGYYKVHDNYLVVHTVLEDDSGRRWSIFWHDMTILQKDEITYKEARWPYRVQKVHTTHQSEYYGIFREVVESQKAINQALIQVQLMANTEKVFVQHGAVEDLEEFKTLVNRVNSIIPVNDLGGIRVDQLTREILDQYTIIDKALDRIQRVLGINDSFLGMAYASDSGRKVKLQQNATIMSLRYVTARIENFYKSLATDIAFLAKQYYRATQFLRVTDNLTGERWVELNRPIMMFTGEVDQFGEPVEVPILVEALDPATREHMEDEEGNIILAPVSEEDSDFEFTEFDIQIESTAYNDEDEKGQLMLESVMSGQIGSMLSQVNPAAFFKIASLAMKTMGLRYSPQIADILDETAAMLGGDEQQMMQAQMMAMQGGGGQSPMSRSLKLPQNTNEVGAEW